MFKDLRNARKNKNKGKKDKKEKVILSWVIFQFVCNFFLFLGGESRGVEDALWDRLYDAMFVL